MSDLTNFHCGQNRRNNSGQYYDQEIDTLNPIFKRKKIIDVVKGALSDLFISYLLAIY